MSDEVAKLRALLDEAVAERARYIAERDEARAMAAAFSKDYAEELTRVNAAEAERDALRARCEAAEAKAATYQRDWYDAKSEFGTAMAKMGAKMAKLEAVAKAARDASKSYERDDASPSGYGPGCYHASHSGLFGDVDDALAALDAEGGGT